MVVLLSAPRVELLHIGERDFPLGIAWPEHCAEIDAIDGRLSARKTETASQLGDLDFTARMRAVMLAGDLEFDLGDVDKMIDA
jgi:hypothetical protein